MNIEHQIGMKKIDREGSIELIPFVALGALAWFVGVLFIRAAGTVFFKEGSLWLAGLYLLTIPGVWLAVKGVALAGKLSGFSILIAIAIMNFTATLLDGVAIAWLPSLYNLPFPAQPLAAAWLLWFVGLSLACGYWESQRLPDRQMAN